MEETEINYVKVSIVGLVILAVIGLMIWGFFGRSTKQVIAPAPVVTTPVRPAYQAPIIDVRHQYKNGTHTFAGLIDLPSACYSLTPKIGITAPAAPLAGQTAANALINIDLTSKDSGAACAQVVTPTFFKTSIAGGSKYDLKGTLNGKEIRFNIFEIGADENIDAMNPYIKG